MKTKSFVFTLLLASLLASLLTGCGAPANASEVRSNLPRQSASAPQEDILELTRGGSEFTFDLLKALADTPGNLVFSPYSISQAMAMAYAGARGDTEAQMAAVLRYSLPQERLHPAFNSLEQALTAPAAEKGAFTLKIANALWAQQDYPFRQEYLDLLASSYGAGLRVTDFSKDPEAARGLINRWVEEQTNGLIKDIVPPGAINDLTRLVLANAIYFKADWIGPFQKDSTIPQPFTLADGSVIQTPMMNQMGYFNYMVEDDLSAVELPYMGGRTAMLVIIPAAGKFEAVQARLSANELERILARLQGGQVLLGLPKFKYESSLNLKQVLKALGLNAPFEDGADFSGMDGSRDLRITDILHKAVIAVDEQGTEAAAATVIIVGATSAPAEPVTIRAERPFFFLIRDTQTGAVLFAGRVSNPAE